MLRVTLALTLLLLSAAPASAQNPWLQRRVLNIAHQGGEAEFPSNTMYAFQHSVKAGADMLELDVGYWFAGGKAPYDHKAKRHPFRGKRLKVPTLQEVMKAFSKTPINVEIKGRTKAEKPAEYLQNAEVLARLLKSSPRRDIIVVSFQQPAVNRFHELAPAIPVAPGIDGAAGWILNNAPPGDGVVAFQLPITYTVGGQVFNVTAPENVARAHAQGYAWHTWLSDDGESRQIWTNLIDWCVDGVMTAKPVAFEKLLKSHPAPASCG